MSPLHLSDVELDAAELGRSGELGPGIVHRVCAETQWAFFDPPQLAAGAPGRGAKYR
jgi:hypothetical protein